MTRPLSAISGTPEGLKYKGENGGIQMQRNTEPLQLFAEAEGQTTGEITVDAGQNETQTQTEQSAARLSWRDIMSDPEYRAEYDREVQSIVKKRLKGRQNAEEKLERLKPVLSAVSRRFAGEQNLDTLDAQGLAEKIMDDGSGKWRGRAREHLDDMRRQEAQMRERYPGFDLERELENERFVRLTAPHTGLSLEDAYCAIHYNELKEAEARKSLCAIAGAVRAGDKRPREISGRQSPSRSASDPKMMSREEREALKKRIYEAKAQGKKLPYGG